MPTDLLFEYDSEELKPEAAETLKKLGTLINKNMHARFTIEGHTDSFGSDEYNEKLSLRRAVAVKEWLEKNMDMREADIRAVGYGKSRLIAPATGSIAEQQINRRVEIVISPN
jgi:outer membrane protein OmpA-like peptidoglycan-associated protein